MKIILLAAGFGTRLRPITNKTPKCMVKINNKPLLSYWLELLFKNHEYPVLINTHYLSDIVEGFIEKNKYKKFITTSHEKNILGTAGTLIANKNFIKKDTVLLAHADNLTQFNLDVIEHSGNVENKIFFDMKNIFSTFL